MFWTKPLPTYQSVKMLYDEFKQLVQDLRDQGLLPHYQDTVLVSPLNSQVYIHCFHRTGGK